TLTPALPTPPQAPPAFGAWQHSLDAALSTGEIYSRAVPITPKARCNDIGQVYSGPVVAVVDARTYSAGDLFAAGFVDHRIGPLVSVDDATGGGGANVWQIGDIRRALSGTDHAIAPLPEDVGFSLSVRRALRVGGSASAEIEDTGVRGQFRHKLTRRDLLDGNKDLIEYCARLLLSESASHMAVSGDTSEVVVRTGRLDRIDVYLDKRPLRASIDVSLDAGAHRIELPPAWSELDVRGYRGESLLQRRRIHAQDL
ncbi:MAG: S41 family peptidase, partial [Geminicoccaceae bacterium]